MESGAEHKRQVERLGLCSITTEFRFCCNPTVPGPLSRPGFPNFTILWAKKTHENKLEKISTFLRLPFVRFFQFSLALDRAFVISYVQPQRSPGFLQGFRFSFRKKVQQNRNSVVVPKRAETRREVNNARKLSSLLRPSPSAGSAGPVGWEAGTAP